MIENDDYERDMTEAEIEAVRQISSPIDRAIILQFYNHIDGPLGAQYATVYALIKLAHALTHVRWP